ncbi:MAG: mannose-1-phosphate guanylyltransferase/mannose-6-phosphate isomerase [Synergistaceae bacterium]|jgi:mannose-1-phosphate guanylyltransferase/mannose-6-phosphate isomerase|nr:mannose-1-phosphate guanylyltransferase/mannose-6-phosphate isomerase [Synergistaceae bacterium]
MPDVYGLILAGGSGVRLWPRSREELPKQFLSLLGGKTMLQETVTRMLSVLPMEHLHAVAGSRWGALVDYQAREVARVPENFLIREPAARNTAPAILLGCEFLRRKGAGDGDVIVAAPSDHLVKDLAAFKEALHRAVRAAGTGCLVTLGVTPNRAETGFGYIWRGASGGDWYEAGRFVEKPDAARAREYVESGEYLWNSGIFVFTPETLCRELEQAAPSLFAEARKGYDALLENFEALPSVSFDNAVMERAERIAVVELDAGWSDVGSWDLLHDVLEKDGAGNVLIGDVLPQDSANCFVDSRGRLTALVDVNDLIVVDSPDALFIAGRGSSQKVRDVVERLKAAERKEAVQVAESARPWGLYKVICEEKRFKVKRLIINPGRRLSLQYHHHRSEHWIVVRGTALTLIDGREQFVHEGESVFIPKNVRHRLENPGKVDLEIVEIQGGEYLGEDDIVRLDDDFRRA